MAQKIIDVRELEEYDAGHATGAINIPLSLIQSDKTIMDELDLDDTYVVYCQSGNRSSMAIKLFENKGFKNLINGINQRVVEEKYI